MKQKRYSFVLDQMLGRLAKWLRLMGYDALYFRDIPDRRLVQIAREEKRVLLTRDTRLMKRREIKKGVVEALLIEPDLLDKQLEQLASELGLSPQGVAPLCSLCNVPLDPVEKETVKGLVPSYVFETQTQFARCPSCGRLYWKGTHWQHIQEELVKVFKSGEESEK
jgi:uncharacterized protein with PIN domain